MNVSSSTAVQSTQKTTQLQKNEQSNPQALRSPTENVKQSQPARLQPYVNTQGQTTGQNLNVTA